MKALRTVAVALGVTLGALIVIPLVVLAGLFIWLKLTEEDDEEALELEQEGDLIDRPDAAVGPPAVAPEPDPTPADPAGVSVPRARRATRASDGSPKRPC